MTTEELKTLNQKIQLFINKCQALVAANHAGYSWPCPVLGFDLLVSGDRRRFVRIVRTDDQGVKSAYCFIDSHSGDVYKDDGWRGPQQKAVRGSIYAASPEEFMDWFGPRHLR